jgi:hypothetical protein
MLLGLYCPVMTWTIVTSASLVVVRVKIYISNSKSEIELNLYYDPDVKMMVNIYIMAGREPTT